MSSDSTLVNARSHNKERVGQLLMMQELQGPGISARGVAFAGINLYVLQRTSNFTYSYQAIAFSLSAWWLQITAMAAVLANRKTSFAVTSKSAHDGARPSVSPRTRRVWLASSDDPHRHAGFPLGARPGAAGRPPRPPRR